MPSTFPCRFIGLNIKLLGETSIASTISYLDNALVYIGSTYGDPQVRWCIILHIFLKLSDVSLFSGMVLHYSSYIFEIVSDVSVFSRLK